MSLFYALDLVPTLEHLGGIRALRFPEDMRMTPNELFGDATGDSVEVETAVFSTELSVKYDLKEEVTEFLTEIRVITDIDCGDHFVSLLEQTGAERCVSLLAVPRAAARSAQGGDDGSETFERWKRFRWRRLHRRGVSMSATERSNGNALGLPQDLA